MVMKLMERKAFFGYIGRFEKIWSIRSIGMEKYRGKNEKIRMSSKKGSFSGQKKKKCRWTDVSAETVNGSFKFSLVFI
jgi:hypothetical protein